MRDLIVIPQAAALSLDSAAAFLRTSFPDADWLAIDGGDGARDGSRDADGVADPGTPADPPVPDGLGWLFGDGARAGVVTATEENRVPKEQLESGDILIWHWAVRRGSVGTNVSPFR